MNQVSPSEVRFSPSEAALEGFRLTRERPGTVLAWAGLYAVGIFIIAAVMMASLNRDFIDLVKHGQLQDQDPEVLAGMLAQSWPAFILVLVLTVGLMSVIMGGIYRLVLRPQEPGFVHLRLGKDELRLTLVNLALFAFGMVCLAIGFALIAVAEQASPLFGVLVTLAVVVLTAWIGVRLSLATPMTFALRRISFREAWGLTSHRFWSLLGMIVLTVVFYVIVWLLMGIIIFAVIGIAGGQHAAHEIGSLSPVAAVATLLTVVLQLVLQILQVVMIYAPFGVAYQQLHGDPPANPLRPHPHNG